MPGKAAGLSHSKQGAVTGLHELSCIFEIRRQRRGARASVVWFSWRRQGDFGVLLDTEAGLKTRLYLSPTLQPGCENIHSLMLVVAGAPPAL